MKYSDLLARPWAEMNCGEVVAEGLRRLGMTKAAEHIPVDQAAAARVLRNDGRTGGWFRFAEPDMKHWASPGDLVVADGPGGSDVYHVSLVLEGGQTLTSTERHGVHCVPVMRTHGVRAIYRWSP
jgi:cell wall-associated NlpC family hydrolase